MTSFHVKTTSVAVSGSPSLHRKPGRNLSVHVFWSGSTFQDSARAGPGSCVTRSICISGAKRSRISSSEARSVASKGLNVMGAPRVASVRRPPGWPGSHWATSGAVSAWPAGRRAEVFFPQPHANKSTAGKTTSSRRKMFMRFRDGDSRLECSPQGRAREIREIPGNPVLVRHPEDAGEQDFVCNIREGSTPEEHLPAAPPIRILRVEQPLARLRQIHLQQQI